ncbi:uncharacterized protein LOC144091977 [Stigmatopora argus]
MQSVYLHSRHQQLEVFTTVLSPRECHLYKETDEKMASVHSYNLHWPSEMDLTTSDVLSALPDDFSERLHDGHFPEIGQVALRAS